MKKVAIGCLILLVVGGAAAAGVMYYGYMKVKGMAAQFAELGQVSDIERGVRVKGPYVAPESGELTAGEVDKLMAVQTKVRDGLGTRFAEIQRNYKSLADKKQADVTDLPALFGAYRDLAHALVEAKRTQVAALNDAGISLEEYKWIRDASYKALGIPFMDLDISQAIEKARNGVQPGANSVTVGGAFTGAGTASNLKLVEKFRKPLEDYVPLASFGL